MKSFISSHFFYWYNFITLFFNAHANCPSASVCLSKMFLITGQSHWILFCYLNSSHSRQIWETCSYFKDLLLLAFVQLLVLPSRNTGTDSRATLLIFKLSICRMPEGWINQASETEKSSKCLFDWFNYKFVEAIEWITHQNSRMSGSYSFVHLFKLLQIHLFFAKQWMI